MFSSKLLIHGRYTYFRLLKLNSQTQDQTIKKDQNTIVTCELFFKFQLNKENENGTESQNNWFSSSKPRRKDVIEEYNGFSVSFPFDFCYIRSEE